MLVDPFFEIKRSSDWHISILTPKTGRAKVKSKKAKVKNKKAKVKSKKSEYILLFTFAFLF
jgi:hypothetical protein